jgi:hypothetical protein
MVLNEATTPPSFLNYPPSSKDARAHRRKQSPDVRRSFFSRVYSGNKAVVPSKVAEGSEGEDEHDYSTIPVDQTGLPFTYSDHDLDNISNLDLALIERQRLNHEEQDHALDSLLNASRALSKLWFQQKQYRYSSGSESTDGSQRSSIECVGPSTLQELDLLRSAINSLSDAFDKADMSGHARKLRQQRNEEDQAKRVFTIPSLKRKSLPDYDCPVDIIAPEDINPYLTSPEPQEELVSLTSPLMMRTPKMRGVFTARALRKLEHDGSSEESSDEEDRSIAQYYMSKHRASRKNDFTGLSRASVAIGKGAKAARRRTSILGSRDEMKSHLLIQAEGADRQHQDINANFLETLDDEHRRATAPASVNLSSQDGDSSSGSSDERRSSDISEYSAESARSHSPPSEVSSFHSSTTLVDADDYSLSDESWLGSLSLSNTSVSSGYPYSEAELEFPSTAGYKVMAKQSPTAFSPPRPKRHPLRPDNLVMTRLSKIDGEDSHYISSTDVTPRPCDLTFQR